MERRGRYLFTLCLIIGFQIHVPVTMFPADSKTGYTFQSGSEPSNLDFSDNVRGKDAPKSLIKDESVYEFAQFHSQTKKQENPAGVIGLELLHENRINGNSNQGRFADRHEFNGGMKLNGLGSDLSTDHNKSVKSVINRPPEDLRIGKLEHIELRLANLSANLLTRKNILPSNNGQVVVKDRELNKDGDDKNNNNTAITSEQSQSTQTNPTRISGDKVLDTNEKSMFDILWPSAAVDRCPQGFAESEHSAWRGRIGNLDVVKIENGCGSMQNRLITFNDSSKACVRYRLNTEQLQGDIYSYYLGKLLGMAYTPPTLLHMVDASRQWSRVWDEINSAKWSENKPIIVTKWIESLESVYMPGQMKDMKRKLHQANYQLHDNAQGNVCDLVQWTDLIVFDYISANLDRVVNNVFNLKWNHKMLEKPIHNLEKSKRTGQFVFIDNESGLFHGYRLLDTYGIYLKTLLDNICMFRPQTVQAIEKLYMEGNAGEKLQYLYEKGEKLHRNLPRIQQRNVKILQSRINDVYKHMQMCRHLS